MLDDGRRCYTTCVRHAGTGGVRRKHNYVTRGGYATNGRRRMSAAASWLPPLVQLSERTPARQIKGIKSEEVTSSCQLVQLETHRD